MCNWVSSSEPLDEPVPGYDDYTDAPQVSAGRSTAVAVNNFNVRHMLTVSTSKKLVVVYVNTA